MEKTYPTNLLIKLFCLYDPSMNRLDSWMDWTQQKQNKRQIKQSIKTTPLILDVLSLSLDQLDNRRKDILLARYKEGKTLKECGERYKLSAERIRQLSETAVSQLRKQASGPFFSLIWPDSGALCPDEWLKWVMAHCENEVGQPLPYANIPKKCQNILTEIFNEQAKETYETVVNEGAR